MQLLDKKYEMHLKDEAMKVYNYMPVPINDVVMQIVEGLMKLKQSNLPSSRIMTDELSAFTQNGGSVSISMVNGLQSQIGNINEVKRLIRPSQIQLLLYILYSWRKEESDEFILDIREYFKIRGIRRRKENVDRFYEDLYVLSALSINIIGKNKKQEYQITGSLLNFKKSKDVIIYLDSWISNLSSKTYTLLNKQFFRYIASDYYNIMLSLKLSQLIKVNANKRNKIFQVKTNTFLKFLGIRDKQIKKQGYNYFYRLLDKSFIELKEKEDYKIAFVEVPASYDDFIQIRIDYSHEWLYNYYQKLAYK